MKYDNKVNGILGTLHGLGAKTHHNVDATNLKVCICTCSLISLVGLLFQFEHILFRADSNGSEAWMESFLQDYEFMRQGDKLVKFSRIIFNFPCVGLLDEQQLQILQEKERKKFEHRMKIAGKGRKQKEEVKKSSHAEVSGVAQLVSRSCA